jgi:hypothetical protein
MKKIIIEQLTTKLTLLIVGLTAASGLLVPATYASFHPVTTGEIADNTIQSRDISNTLGVASVDIRDGQVGSVDIGTGQVASGDIQDRTIRRADVAVGALSPSIQIVVSGDKELGTGPNTLGVAFADCPSGYRVTGGGFAGSTFLNVYESSPEDVNTWFVAARNDNTSLTGSFRAYAVCMGPIPP